MKTFNRTRGLIAGLAVAGVVALVGATPAMAEDRPAVAGANVVDPCVTAAGTLVKSKHLSTAAPFDFACVGKQVSVTVRSPQGSTTVESAVQYQDVANSARSRTSSALAVAAAAPTCPASPVRKIVSELQENIDLCVIYGQSGSPKYGTWARRIVVYWTMYPGWKSAQSKIQTISSAGQPTLRGTVTSRKQNGIFAPTALAHTAWVNYGNATTAGYAVGGLTQNSSYSLALADLDVKDSSYAFEKYIGTETDSHRFTCSTSMQRCYFPGGKEAGL